MTVRQSGLMIRMLRHTLEQASVIGSISGLGKQRVSGARVMQMANCSIMTFHLTAVSCAFYSRPTYERMVRCMFDMYVRLLWDVTGHLQPRGEHIWTC